MNNLWWTRLSRGCMIWLLPFPLSRQQVVFLSQAGCVSLVELLKGDGMGGEEPNRTMARKSGTLSRILSGWCDKYFLAYISMGLSFYRPYKTTFSQCQYSKRFSSLCFSPLILFSMGGKRQFQRYCYHKKYGDIFTASLRKLRGIMGKNKTQQIHKLFFFVKHARCKLWTGINTNIWKNKFCSILLK